MLNGVKYIGILSENKIESLQLILYGWIRQFKLITFELGGDPLMTAVLKHIFFIRTYLEKYVEKCIIDSDEYRGVWYELNRDAITLTVSFYNHHMKDKNKFIACYDRLLNTDKFEAYLKKVISSQVFVLLRQLNFLHLSGLKENILVLKKPLNRFVIKYMEEKYNVKYRVKEVSSWGDFFSLFGYYAWLFKEFICRGVVFNQKKKEYKLCKEATSGFYLKTLRDDMLINNKEFSPKDLLILGFTMEEPYRKKAFKESLARGFDAVFIPKLKINVNENIFAFLSFYFLIPLKFYFFSILKDHMRFFYYLILFQKRSFPIEVLMNLYRIKCYVSTKDYGDVEETIILNKYGTKSVILHWSDLTPFRDHFWAFLAHNIYFVWGNIHYDYHSANLFVNKKINVGCIFKEEYNKALARKEEIICQIIQRENRGNIVTFFDTSFGRGLFYSDSFLLEYLEMIEEFCRSNKNNTILLKPKNEGDYFNRISMNNVERYKKIWDKLVNHDNFIYVDPRQWDIGEIIAISDICVNMGMNSPATIALICGRNALYFDNTGNREHPFAKKYRDVIVFEDKERLFKQLESILTGKFNCRSIIKEEEIRQFDAFPDDNALGRIRESLHELTSVAN